MIIEKTDHQIIVDSNIQANAIIQNNIDLINEKIQSKLFPLIIYSYPSVVYLLINEIIFF